ncbi:putative myb-like DNA-binding protein [Phytophthora cinnamomi]|uniref:putative myb-like DNA-binding protein n=1 Tax=Phytophthora cinnamomi TaxID=4785 RepID=UPI0035597DFF|nr:putative myb-like DNA-binding protein [Phytophthora cinnamomi]
MTMLTSPTAVAAADSPTISTKPNTSKTAHPSRAVGVWSSEEHDRFLEALKRYPQGPWKAITEYVGTRSVRQVQTHAQKYQEKVSRRLHGMQTGKAIRLRREHRIDHDILALHTLISFPSEVRNQHPRRSRPNEAKHAPVVTTPAVAAEQTKAPEFQRPTIVLNDKDFNPIMDNDGASPSSVSSSFLFDDSVFALMDVDDLPTLSESLDFFIENFS